jgi:hypothetical protein
MPWPSEPHWKVRSPDVLEASPSAPFLLHGLDLAAARDKTVAPHGCDLFASSLPSAYGRLTDPTSLER